VKVRSYVDNYDLWLEWLLAQESGDCHYVLDWPEFRDLWRAARIRSLLADCPAEQRDGLIDTVAVVLGVPVETVRQIAGG
jgi:hypothetical protein